MTNKVVNKEPTTQRDSFGELLGQIANTSADVVRDEIKSVTLNRLKKSILKT